MKTIFATFLFLSSIYLHGQATDYRDEFMGLFHTINPPCISTQEHNPPHHYIYFQKSPAGPDSIFVTDTLSFGGGCNGISSPWCVSTTLQQSDSTYFIGTGGGKFLTNDSLRALVYGIICGGSGSYYYLKRLTPVGIIEQNGKEKEWYLFPNPAVDEVNVIFPAITQILNFQLIDINGRLVIGKGFTTTASINLMDVPKGIYTALIRGNNINSTKRVVITD
jgi:hypothetical protein